MLTFTEDELFQVYSRFVPAAEARVMARASLSTANVPVAAPRQTAGLDVRPIPSTDLSDDTLILLSLLSEETNEKVMAYRRSYYGGRAIPEADEEAWNRRRAELKAWADAGHPRVAD
jgi:hypothetical protein